MLLLLFFNTNHENTKGRKDEILKSIFSSTFSIFRVFVIRILFGCNLGPLNGALLNWQAWGEISLWPQRTTHGRRAAIADSPARRVASPGRQNSGGRRQIRH